MGQPLVFRHLFAPIIGQGFAQRGGHGDLYRLCAVCRIPRVAVVSFIMGRRISS